MSSSRDEELEETHTFRCEVADFKDFLNGKTQYRYEIACGKKFGESIPINFEMYLPSKESSNFYFKGIKFDNKNHSLVDYIGIKAGIDEIIKKPISLMVIPKLLKDDHTSYFVGASRQIKLNLEKSMNWNQFVKVETLHTTRGLASNNKVIIEFDVKLFPHQQPKSILIKSTSVPSVQGKQGTSSPNTKTIPRSTSNSNSRVSTTSTPPTKPYSSNGTNSASKTKMADKLTNTDEDVSIIDEQRTDVIKLEVMQKKFTTDLRSVLTSANRSDVTFQVKGGVLVKGHRLILAARSQALNSMLADDKKNEDGSWTVVAEDIEPEVMNTILEYIYTGQLGLDYEKYVHQLLIASHKFQLLELIEYLDLKVPDLLTVNNISNFLLLSKTMSLKHLEQVMTRYFVEHRAEVVQTAEFAELREKNPGVLVDWLLAN